MVYLFLSACEMVEETRMYIFNSERLTSSRMEIPSKEIDI